MPPSRAQARLAEFLETAERLRTERTTSGGVLETVEATPPEAWPSLAERPEFQTNAALEKLGEEVHRRIDRNPGEALVLAELATSIADALPENVYPAVTLAQIRAMAWKDRATVLRFLGQIPETFEAIERADEILKNHVVLRLDRAIVDMVQALALVDTGKYDDACAIAITCGSVFLSHGDVQRALQAGEIEGHALYEMGRYRDAQALFTSLLDVAHLTNDSATEARCHHNIAWCAISQGDYKTANIQLSEAISKLVDLGQTLAATRAQLAAGKILTGKGQTETGLKYLRAARKAFEQYGMSEEAGLCALYMAETFLNRGDSDSARKLVRHVAEQFKSSRMALRIINAVSELEHQITLNTEPAAAVRHVYTLIESAEKHLPL